VSTNETGRKRRPERAYYFAYVGGQMVARGERRLVLTVPFTLLH
jgi:hypothetical protein